MLDAKRYLDVVRASGLYMAALLVRANRAVASVTAAAHAFLNVGRMISRHQC